MSRQGSSPIIASLDGRHNWNQGRGVLKTDQTVIAVAPSENGGDPDDIQIAINAMEHLGGGVVSLRVGTYLPEDDIVIPNNVVLEGEVRDAVVIDFQGGAFQVKAQGANAYTTGTVSVNNNSDTVTGSGTAWTTAMIGQSIILSGVWFAITDVASTTSLTIEAPFDYPSIATQNYVIADTVSGTTVRNLIIQNSTAATGGLLYQYVNSGYVRGVTVYDSTIGINFLSCSYVSATGWTVIGNGTGINVDNCGVWTFNDFGAYASTGDNMTINRMVSASMSNATLSSAGANGATITNSSNWGFYDMTITTNTGKGVEISTSSAMQLFSLATMNNGSDGIKLTSNADRIMMNNIYSASNTGYGFNIANANCDKNNITSCHTVSNTAGTINNSGTSTILANNQT